MKRKGLRFQLSFGTTLIVFLVVAGIFLGANLLVKRQFRQYIISEQEEFAEGLADNLRSQYDEATGKWNLDYVHGFGMYALDDGYIIKLFDENHYPLWDAENHDMALCHQIMRGIEEKMQKSAPDADSRFVTSDFQLNASGKTVGYAEISYYSPYYSEQGAFDFLNSLNLIMLIFGLLSLGGAAVVSVIYAKRLITPLRETAKAAEEIAQGDYTVRFNAKPPVAEIADLQSSVEQMAKSLDEQEKRARGLTRDVAHELRTPLANVSSYLEAITEGVWEPTNERLRECMNELDRLKDIIADLEALHSIEDEGLTLNRQKFSLKELAETVAVSFDSVIKDSELSLEIIGDEAVTYADKKRMHQAVFNLISNAVKYTSPKDCIVIETRATDKSSELSVINHGKPIPKEEQGKIFDRFYRLDSSRSRSTGGAGIGLSIVKAVMKAHGGTVSVSSNEAETRFTISIPIKSLDIH